MLLWEKRYKYRTRLWHRLLKNDVAPVDHAIIRYGGEDGGWYLPSELIKPEWLVYDFGIGYDISFDIALLHGHGCTIHGFDPTPKSIEFMRCQGAPGFQFHPLGVWDEEATIKFWQPNDARFASYSALNLGNSTEYVECAVKPVRALAADLGHDRIDLIKLDIEGAEQRVIPDLLADGFRPTVLCVEFDQAYEIVSRRSLGILRNSLRLHKSILAAGYRLINKSGWCVTYLYEAFA